MEMHERRAVVTKGKRGAAKPIFGKGEILRTLGGGAQREEMTERYLRLGQEAKRDPAGEELRFDIGVARDRPVLRGNIIGDARLPSVECRAAIDAALCPPTFEVDQLVRLVRSVEQHL